MKQLYTLIILIFMVSNSFAQFSWTKQNPHTTDVFHDVHAFNASEAIAVGASGSIWETPNGGTDWNPIISPVSNDLNDVFFYNSTTGWIVAEDKLLKSTDGGTVWNTVYSSFPYSMKSVFFITDKIGWVCGAYGEIEKTTDGGSTWTDQVPVQLSYGWFYSIYFIDADHGFAVGSSASYARTEDGGANWSMSETEGAATNYSVFFSTATKGWIVGDAEPQETTDGGVSWGNVPGFTRERFGWQTMHDVKFEDNLHGFIVGNGGETAATIDGGTNWTVTTTSSGINLFAVDMGSTTTAWAVGHTGVIEKTTNNGTAWTNQYKPITSQTLNSSFFIDSNTGWAVGKNGTVIKTINGGNNWSSVNIGATETLNDVYFPTASVGYIVGRNVFYYTGDGGTTWTERNNITDDFVVTRFINENVGWIAGGTETGGGLLLKTINRGASWTSEVVTYTLLDMEIVDATVCVAVGGNGLILRTTDSGKSWSTVTSGTTDALTSVEFVDPGLGFITTDGSASGTPKILKTIDGGATWSNYVTMGTAITDLEFISPTEGWSLSGNDSHYTTDGGGTWNPEGANSNYPLNDISILKPTLAYRVGDYGIIDRGERVLVNEQPPYPATVLNPLMNDYDMPTWTDFNWADGGGVAPDGYKIYIGTDGGGTTTPTNVVNGTDLGLVTSYDHYQNLDYGTTYYWQIVPYNAYGDALNCPIWKFSTRTSINFGGGGLLAPNFQFANSVSGAPSQPIYGWIDPVADGHTEITSWDTGDDNDGYKQVSVGFTFPYFGISYTDLYIGTNGYITFSSGATDDGNALSIPNNDAVNNLIAVCAMDLDDGSDGKIYYGTTGGNFVVTWYKYEDAGPTVEYITCQIILKPTGYIEFQYNNSESTYPLGTGIGNNCLVGLEGPYGVAGIQYRNDGIGGPIFGSPMAVGFGDDNGNLPVELTSFTGTTNENDVILNWQTATEVNNYGFEIERQFVTQIASNLSNDDWATLGFVQGSGNSNSPKSYEFVDESPLSDSAEYRLKQIDTDGGFKYYSESVLVAGFGTTDVNDENLPTKFELEQNYPNPFNPSTTIKYSIPSIVGIGHAHSATDVSLKIYDILGCEVATLVNKQQKAGNYEVDFDASKLSSGLYFYRLSATSVGSAQSFVNVKKMLLVK